MDCEICGINLPLTQLIKCDKCGSFVCQNCSDYVEGESYNHNAYEILCINCINDLSFET